MRIRCRATTPVLAIPERFGTIAAFVLLIAWLAGCRTTAPIHVWHQSQHTCPQGVKIAISTLTGDPQLVASLEGAMLAQRPQARPDFAIISSRQMAERSPVQLASTANIESDLTALQAAKRMKANLLLEGEIMSAKLNDPAKVEPRSEAPKPREYLLISWRLIEVDSSSQLATHIVSIDNHQADERYPDLIRFDPNPTSRLLAAGARDSWKVVAPSVEVEGVELMVPWLQLGAIRTRAGIVDAKRGRWDLAEQRWINPFNVSARHNLAIAQAAKEDFSAAKQQLRKTRWPLSTRLPPESFFWLDQKHRQFVAAHGLENPIEGWMFPDPQPDQQGLHVRPVEIESLPWWTAVPLAKPPQWTWRDWLRQPLVL
jgi:hypothetical protein